MILDRLERAELYNTLNPHLVRAFAFLRQEGLKDLPDGRVDIDADNLYAVVLRAQGQPAEKAKLEVHRKYIDVQYLLSGSDQMGWKDIKLCANSRGPYDPQADAQIFDDTPSASLNVGPGDFAVFFPHDAHAPGIGTGPFHKVVVKVAVE